MNTPSQKPSIPPVLGLALGILAASTASIFIRYAQSYQMPSLVIATYRLVLASLVLAPVVLIRYKHELLSIRRRDLALAMLAGVFLALHFATWITSLEYTTVASSVVLVATAPLWVAILSPLTIKEPITRLMLVGMSLSLVGGIVVGLSDTCTWSGGSLACPSFSEFLHGQALVGDLLALVGAIMAGAYLLAGRRVRTSMSLIPYIFVVYGMAAVVLVVLMLGTGEKPWGYPTMAYLWIILLALVPQLLGHTSFNWALRYLSAAFVSISLLGEPIGSSILAYFLFRESPTILKLFGAILILVGIYTASRGGNS
jgi:drug/metabolite transporter (DMT)-like permease